MYKKLSYLFFSDLQNGDIIKIKKENSNEDYKILIVGDLIDNNTRKVYNIRSLNPFLECKIVVSSTGTYKYISNRENIIIEIMQIKRFSNYIKLITDYNYIRGLNLREIKVQNINIIPDLEAYDKRRNRKKTWL